MIHSARPTVPPVAITILIWKLFCEILKSGDGQTARVKIVITTGVTGSASWINLCCGLYYQWRECRAYRVDHCKLKNIRTNFKDDQIYVQEHNYKSQDRCHQWSTRPDPQLRTLFFVVLFFYIWKVGTDAQTDGRTTCAKTMIPTSRHFGLAKWINAIYIFGQDDQDRVRYSVFSHILFYINIPRDLW